MIRFRTFAAGVAAAGFSAALVASATGTAGAAGDPTVGTQVLNLLCASKAGAPVFTPMTIGRCQDARAGDGFVLEELICEGLLDGAFERVTDTRPNRVNWFCFHTQPPTP